MATNYKVVVTDNNFADLCIERKILSEVNGVELIEGNARTKNELIELTKEADAIINQYASMNNVVIE